MRGVEVELVRGEGGRPGGEKELVQLVEGVD